MEVRTARRGDGLAIHALLREARRASPPSWPWSRRLGQDGFVVVETEHGIQGALLATADASPVAWVRLAAVADGLPVGIWLDLSLPPLLGHLQGTGVGQLTWMDRGEWAGPSLATRDFYELVEVITFSKTDRALPSVDAPGVTVRPASDDDLATLAAIDRKAFSPTWWRSARSIRRRAARASHFAVAERANQVIGYTEHRLHLPMAHLNRIAVDPAHQGQGVGALLLRSSLIAMWRGGAETVDLNTQRSNHRSRRLYQRFGFRATGDSVVVWARDL